MVLRPARPSWCYGTPGLARARQLAGLALRDLARQEAAEHALASTRCSTTPMTHRQPECRSCSDTVHPLHT